MMTRFLITLLVAISTGLSVSSPGIAQETRNETEVKRYVKKLDPRLDALIDVDTEIEVLSTGHQWAEGPVWIPSDDALLFSDVPRNKIYHWKEGEGTKVFLDNSGYEGPTQSKEPGSNGLMLDKDGHLIVCDHGNHRIYRREKDGTRTTLIDRFEGKRFNSPNDLDIDKDGNIYFTDPPYGLADPAKSELGYFGVYRLNTDGSVNLLIRDLVRPNGIALSPDEKTLYVAQSHKPEPIYMAFEIQDNGSMSDGQILFDASEQAKNDRGMPDGLAIDVQGNLWATGPGGVLIISPDGTLLGHIMMDRKTANCAFGGDGSTLYMTSSDVVCRVKTKTRGRNYVATDSGR